MTTMGRGVSLVRLFSEELESWRSRERAESVLLVAQESTLIRILLAWDRIPVKRRQRITRRPASRSQEESWEWLWENATYPIDSLVEATGLSKGQVEKGVAMLRGNQLIYPDGSLNRFAAQYLKSKVLGLFKVKTGGGANRP